MPSSIKLPTYSISFSIFWSLYSNRSAAIRFQTTLSAALLSALSRLTLPPISSILLRMFFTSMVDSSKMASSEALLAKPKSRSDLSKNRRISRHLTRVSILLRKNVLPKKDNSADLLSPKMIMLPMLLGIRSSSSSLFMTSLMSS